MFLRLYLYISSRTGSHEQACMWFYVRMRHTCLSCSIYSNNTISIKAYLIVSKFGIIHMSLPEYLPIYCIQVIIFLFSLFLLALETYTVLKGGRDKTIIIAELTFAGIFFVLSFTGFIFLTNEWRKTSTGQFNTTHNFDAV